MLKCWGIHPKKSVPALVATMMVHSSAGSAVAAEKDTTIKNVIILIPLITLTVKIMMHSVCSKYITMWMLR